MRDLLRDLGQFHGAQGRVGDLSQYVRAQGEGMFDVLASDESATAGEMLTAAAFADIRDVVSRFYKLIFVDTGNNVRAQNWQAAIDATDQLVVTMSARNDSAETAARMLDHLEQTGRHRLVRQAVTVVSMPPSRREIDLPPIESHFAARTRAVLLAPYERLIDTGEPIRYAGAQPGDPRRLAEDRRGRGRGPLDGGEAAPSRLERVRRRGVAVAEELGAAGGLVGLADLVGGPGEHVEAAQEAPVGLVRPRHRAVPLPAVAAQLVQAAVVAGAGVGVGGDRAGPRRAPAAASSAQAALEVGCAAAACS